MPDGSGVDGLFPMLKGSALVQSTDGLDPARGVAGGSKCRDRPRADRAGDAVVRLDTQ